jgi:hypothetical protein
MLKLHIRRKGRKYKRRSEDSRRKDRKQGKKQPNRTLCNGS